MYQLSATVHEYCSVWWVRIVYSVVQDPQSVRSLGSVEHWIVVDEPSGDPLVDALEVMRRAATLELRPNR